MEPVQFSAAAQDQRALANQLAEAQLKVVTVAYDRAAAYTTVIVFGGYAGFFGIWQLAKDHLSKQQALWSALLILVSLLSFVLFEVFKMVVVSRSVLSQAKTLQDPAVRQSPQALAAALHRLEEAQRPQLGAFVVVWVAVLVVAIGGALSGAAVLGYAFIAGLAR